MQQFSFRELMKASQSFADAAASISQAFADANRKKDMLCCSKFYLSLAISQYKRGEQYLISFLKDENLNFCDLIIFHTQMKS